MQIKIEYPVIKCSCGWHFIGRSVFDKWCPQCKTAIKRCCRFCGGEINNGLDILCGNCQANKELNHAKIKSKSGFVRFLGED